MNVVNYESKKITEQIITNYLSFIYYRSNMIIHKTKGLEQNPREID